MWVWLGRGLGRPGRTGLGWKPGWASDAGALSKWGVVGCLQRTRRTVAERLQAVVGLWVLVALVHCGDGGQGVAGTGWIAETSHLGEPVEEHGLGWWCSWERWVCVRRRGKHQHTRRWWCCPGARPLTPCILPRLLACCASAWNSHPHSAS